jgi:predicted tellurium resistance membrane protein TerC
MYKKLTGLISPFWSTVIFVEIMDIAFSVDNVFAAVAFTDKLLLIYIGVFIGIIAMRFVALGFVKLIDKYKFLQTSAFLVVFLLGLKLVCSNYIPKTFAGHDTDLLISLFTLIIFFLPMIIFMTKPRGNKS